MNISYENEKFNSILNVRHFTNSDPHVESLKNGYKYGYLEMSRVLCLVKVKGTFKRTPERVSYNKGEKYFSIGDKTEDYGI